MAIARGKIRWNIPGAGAAYTILHFNGWANQTEPDATEVDGVLTAMRTFVTGIAGVIPYQVTMDVQNELEILNEESGLMLGVLAGTAQTQQRGGAAQSSGWAAAAGAVISWSTAGVRNGRRVRGRTFLVPLSIEAWDQDGTLKTDPYNTLNGAATALRTADGIGELQVWARPTAPGATDGSAFPVSGHRIPDMSAILRSRRS